MICPQCQTKNIAGAAFCDNCGSALTNAAGPSMPSAPSPVVAAPAQTDPPPAVANANLAVAAPPAAADLASPPPANPPVPAPVLSSAPNNGGKLKCSFCGDENDLGNKYCENCGTPLAAPAAEPAAPTPPAPLSPAPPEPAALTPSENVSPAVTPAPVAAPATATALKMILATPASQPPPAGHPRLIVVSNGSYFDLNGYQKVLLGRVDPTSNHFPEVDLTSHGGDEAGVSRKHLQITLEGNQYFAEDLGSSNGSWIGTTRLAPNTRTPLNSGDQLRLGKLLLNFFAQ